MARRFPTSLRLRQLLPAALPLALAAPLLHVGRRRPRATTFSPIGYLAVLASAGTVRRAAVVGVTHLAWACGWWASVTESVVRAADLIAPAGAGDG